MIKGINKQIIEIKCTDDEYFDKVLLFVRADRAGTPEGTLRKNADNFCGKIFGCRRPQSPTRLRAATLVILLALLLGLLICVLALL